MSQRRPGIVQIKLLTFPQLAIRFGVTNKHEDGQRIIVNSLHKVNHNGKWALTLTFVRNPDPAESAFTDSLPQNDKDGSIIVREATTDPRDVNRVLAEALVTIPKGRFTVQKCVLDNYHNEQDF
jgi:hypothetical protein